MAGCMVWGWCAGSGEAWRVYAVVRFVVMAKNRRWKSHSRPTADRKQVLVEELEIDDYVFAESIGFTSVNPHSVYRVGHARSGNSPTKVTLKGGGRDTRSGRHTLYIPNGTQVDVVAGEDTLP